ncbi:hypothetical protein J6590_005180 [Homalodisca vitripennis]|nr:hypothetical protein J6590_005180 [Homalodisca vitripennis]
MSQKAMPLLIVHLKTSHRVSHVTADEPGITKLAPLFESLQRLTTLRGPGTEGRKGAPWRPSEKCLGGCKVTG